ncbi:hypothetical protein OCB15_29350 [Bacillus cereus]|nr:hypothetical protein [Bacillus cereus]
MNNGHYEYNNSFHQYYPNESYPFVMDNRNIDMSRGERPQQWQQLQQFQQQQQQQQQHKCQCDGKEALCVSIPVPITVVLLGTKLQVELPCIRITSEEDITPVLKKLIKSLGGLLGGAGNTSS